MSALSVLPARSLARFLACGLLAATVVFGSAPAAAEARVGQAAPAFRLPDTSGKPVALADFKGRTVVLEWNNPSCPFVKKHYDSGNLQALQARYAGPELAWLVINSTAADHPEYLAPAALAAWAQGQKSRATAFLLDTEGEVGRAYGARTTPQMMVIDPKGVLIYNGAIDDKRSARPEDVADARNHVSAALDEARAGKPVSTPSTTPYGCSIKYR